jgi:hypothetical protein
VPSQFRGDPGGEPVPAHARPRPTVPHSALPGRGAGLGEVGLARLRAFFDDELLIQVGQRMVLTPLAEDLVNPVREALQARSVSRSLIRFGQAEHLSPVLSVAVGHIREARPERHLQVEDNLRVPLGGLQTPDSVDGARRQLGQNQAGVTTLDQVVRLAL